MSRSRYNWWPFMLNIIRDYPARAKQLQELQTQSIVADNSGMPKSGSAGRTVESAAMKQLPRQEQREYEAVHKALIRTKRMKGAKSRLEIVRLTMWMGYTIDGAAMIVNESRDTTRRYRWQFVMLAACMYGLLTEEEYEAEIKTQAAGRKNWTPM